MSTQVTAVEKYSISDIKTFGEIQAKFDEMDYKKGDIIQAQNWRGTEHIGDGFQISEYIGKLANLAYGTTEDNVITRYPFEVYNGTHCAQIKSIPLNYFRVLYEFFGFKYDASGKIIWLIKRRP